MKIYTKQGDKGQTSILGGIKLPKHHVRIEAYGSVDELNANIGFLRDQDIDSGIVDDLIRIQEILFTIGSHLATDKEKISIELPEIDEKEVEFLENKIDEMEEGLPEMKNFILPGGHMSVSSCHLCRVTCRRAERWTSAFAESDKVDDIILVYLNRLSDYFFVLSRQIAKNKGAEEVPWRPK